MPFVDLAGVPTKKWASSGQGSSRNAGGLFDLLNDPLGTAERVANIRNTFRGQTGGNTNGDAGAADIENPTAPNLDVYRAALDRLIPAETRAKVNAAYAELTADDIRAGVSNYISENNKMLAVVAAGVVGAVVFFGRRRMGRR